MSVKKTQFALTFAMMICFSAPTEAHHPDRENQPVYPRIDVIGPLGNRLPPSYRRVYNRPTNIGGWIAYKIAPTSQEAMAWHNATHQNAYKCDRPRLEAHYFYPKPYDALRTGPRPNPDAETVEDDREDGGSLDAEVTEQGDLSSSPLERGRGLTDAVNADEPIDMDALEDAAMDAKLAPVTVDEAVDRIMDQRDTPTAEEVLKASDALQPNDSLDSQIDE